MTLKQPVILINQRYRIEGVIGRGTFGIVCLGTDTHNNSRVAIKLEPNASFLTHESSILTSLAGPGIPRVHWCGREGAFTAMVMDVLGPSLQDLFNHCGRRFSLKTTLSLADQLLARLEHLQSHGVVHRDLKPHNVLMGFGDQGHTVHLVDFGMAAHSRDRSASLARRGFYGTARYASLAAHLSYEQTHRDDVESLAYTLIYFLRGFLPWTGLRAGRQRHDLDVVGAKKIEMSPEDIAKGLPEEFSWHVRYARSLSHGETVDYPALRLIYRRLYEREGFADDGIFDWTHSQPRRLPDDHSDTASDADS